jgi:heme-degrading monooxygenase HmoA
LYRWRVKPGLEAECERAWADVTDDMRARGSAGSCLHRAADGSYFAYARWASRAARDEAFAAAGDTDARRRLRATIDVDLDAFEVEVVDDRLADVR